MHFGTFGNFGLLLNTEVEAKEQWQIEMVQSYYLCMFSHLQQIQCYKNKHKSLRCSDNWHWRDIQREKHCTRWHLWTQQM